MVEKALQALWLPGLNNVYVNTPLSTAPTFDETQNYEIGDYVFHNIKLYKFIQVHTAGAWNFTHVTEVVIGNEIKNIKNEITEKTRNIVLGVIPYANIGTDGTIGESSEYDLAYCKVENGKTYSITITGGALVYGFFIDIPQMGSTAIEGRHVDQVGTTTITVNVETAVYMVVRKDIDSIIQIEEGSTQTSYVPPITAIDTIAREGNKVSDVQVNGTSILNQGIANVPIATANILGAVKIPLAGGLFAENGSIYINSATAAHVKSGTQGFYPLTPARQHESVFYGLAKAAGDTTQSASDNTVGTYTDGAKTAIRTMLGAVGNTDYASSSAAGIVKITGNDGIIVDANGVISSNVASSSQIKNGTNSRASIVTSKQHESVFYGLAKSAGDTTQSSSSNAVGTYTDSAKDAIKTMLGIDLASGNIQNVSGTTVTITGEPNARYICGEVATIDITPPATGTIIVRFTSGSTATVLTLPSTVKMPEWFDALSLEADTIYELSITDGVYGAVMSWAV